MLIVFFVMVVCLYLYGYHAILGLFSA